MEQKTIHINYDSLTQEELEKFIEFVDWNRVPFDLINKKLIKKFPVFKKIKERFEYKKTWISFGKLFHKMELKSNEKNFPYLKVFFVDNKWCMHYDEKEKNFLIL